MQDGEHLYPFLQQIFKKLDNNEPLNHVYEVNSIFYEHFTAELKSDKLKLFPASLLPYKAKNYNLQDIIEFGMT